MMAEDFGITTYNTILIEANDGFAFGNYGLTPEAYASCLAARWADMTK